MKKENRSINVLKGLACILVIINHYHGTGPIGELLYTISHFGVPVFFLVSGYFLFSNDGRTLEKLPRKIKHSFSLLILHISLYILNCACEKIFLYGNAIRKDIVINEVASCFTWKAILDSLLWSKSLFATTGQWFLIALLESYIIFFLLYKAKLGKLIERKSIWIAVVLFLFHIPGRMIIAKVGITEILGENVIKNFVVRNVWFDAFPFMLVGLYIRKTQEEFHPQHRPKMLLMLSAAGVGISIAESYLTKAIIDESDISCVLYFGTIVSAVFAFIWAAEYPERATESTVGRCIEFVGKNLSMAVFFIHVIVARYMDYFISSEEDIFPILLIICTVIIALLVFCIKKHLSQNPKYSLAQLMTTAICVAFLVLPTGNEWRMIGRSTMKSQTIRTEESFHSNNQSTVLITAQVEKGITVDAVEIPVQQFIGGGIKRSIIINDEEYNFFVQYTNREEIEINKSDNIQQIRIWIR